jgi:hypothetical protein
VLQICIDVFFVVVVVVFGLYPWKIGRGGKANHDHE